MGTGTGTVVETIGQPQDGNRDGSGYRNESSSGDRREDGDGNEDRDGNEDAKGDENGDGIGDGKGHDSGEGRGGGEEFWNPPHRKRSRVEDQTLPFRTQHDFCRQEVAPAGSQQLRVQDPALLHRCGTEVRTGHQRRAGGNDDRNREGGGRADEYGNEHEGRDGGESGRGSRNGKKNGEEII